MKVILLFFISSLFYSCYFLGHKYETDNRSTPSENESTSSKEVDNEDPVVQQIQEMVRQNRDKYLNDSMELSQLLREWEEYTRAYCDTVVKNDSLLNLAQSFFESYLQNKQLENVDSYYFLMDKTIDFYEISVDHPNGFYRYQEPSCINTDQLKMKLVIKSDDYIQKLENFLVKKGDYRKWLSSVFLTQVPCYNRKDVVSNFVVNFAVQIDSLNAQASLNSYKAFYEFKNNQWQFKSYAYELFYCD